MELKPKAAAKSKVADKPSNELSEVRMIPLACIADHPEIPKGDLDKEWVAELRESIQAVGLDVPLVVWDGGEADSQMEIKGKVYPATFLIAGNHRRQALRTFLKEAPEKFDKMFPNGIPVRVVSGTQAQAYAARVRENVQRRNPDPKELMEQLAYLRDEMKMTGKEIAKAVGKSASWVSQIFSIEEELGEEGVAAVKSGKVSVTEATSAANAAKQAKKAGKAVSKEDTLASAKAKAADRGDADRAPKKMSAKAILATYQVMPKMAMGDKILLLETLLAYLAGETDKLPKEFKAAVVANDKKKS